MYRPYRHDGRSEIITVKNNILSSWKSRHLWHRIKNLQNLKQKSAVVSRFFYVSWKTSLVQTCCLSIIVKSAASLLRIQKDSSYISLRFIGFAKFVITPVKIVKNSSIMLAKITVKWKFMNVMFFVSWFDQIFDLTDFITLNAKIHM